MSGGLVIIDGPDAVGKTTLARHLLGCDFEKGWINLKYDHNWKNPDYDLWRLQYFALLKASIRLSAGELTVIDRHWPAEEIYGKVYRKGTRLNAEIRAWDRVVRRHCGVYVIAAPQPASAVSRHHTMESVRDEMYKSGPHVCEVATRFKLLWDGCEDVQITDYATFLTARGGMRKRDDAVLYDIDQHGSDLDEVCGRIYDRMLRLNARQYPPASEYKCGNFLGNLGSAEFLFVGERINPRKSGRWPFVDFGHSSGALSQVLQKLNFDETRAVWTNAYADDEHIQALLQMDVSLKVVAFGNIASDKLTHYGIEHTKVIHPAYAKRFNDLDLLERQLKCVI